MIFVIQFVLLNEYCTGVPADQPVIMGVPPPTNSNFTHGRRKFLGKHKNEDRGGVPRLDAEDLLIVSRDAGVSKKKGSASKSKGPPPKKTNAKGKKAAVVVSVSDNSSDDDFEMDDDHMFVSDDPKTVHKPTIMPLEVPFFSTSPRATRSTRHGKTHLKPEPLPEHVEGKKKNTKRGKSF